MYRSVFKSNFAGLTNQVRMNSSSFTPSRILFPNENSPHLHLSDAAKALSHGHLPPPRPLHILLVDGYTPESRQSLIDHNVPLAGDLYTRMLLAVSPIPTVVAKWYACDSKEKLNPDDIPLYVGKNEATKEGKSGSENSLASGKIEELSLGWHGRRPSEIDRDSFVFVGDYDGPLHRKRAQKSPPSKESTSESQTDLEFIQQFPRSSIADHVAYSPHVSVCTLNAPELMSSLSFFDAIAWTGCSLSAYSDDPNVKKQIALVKKAFQLGIPQYGSCWAAQIAVVAAGGKVDKSPKGREMGVGRRIELTKEGLRHPMYKDRRGVFEAFESHDDEITSLPPSSLYNSSTVLATNAHSFIQALEVRAGQGTFWGHQYHPEYSLYDVAMLMYARMEKLVDQGHFKSKEAGYAYVRNLLELYSKGDCKDIAYALGLSVNDFSERSRHAECRSWLEELVLPFYHRRR